MKTILHVYTNPGSAIRQSCNHGWTKLEIDTSEWTEDERNTLATWVIYDGKRVVVSCGDTGLCPGPRHQTAPTAYAATPHCLLLDVAPPTPERLHEIVTTYLEYTAEKIAKQEAKQKTIDTENRNRETTTTHKILNADTEDLLDVNIHQTDWVARTALIEDLRPDVVAIVEARQAEKKAIIQAQLDARDDKNLLNGRGEVCDYLRGSFKQHGHEIRYSIHRSDWPEKLKTRATEAVDRAALQCAQASATWIAAHGSARLKRCHAEEIECAAILRDEFLAKTYPEWVDYQSVPWTTYAPRNPPPEAFALLDNAREDFDSATLHYWQHAGQHGYCAKSEVVLPGDYDTTTIIWVGLGEDEDDEDDDEDDDY